MCCSFSWFNMTSWVLWCSYLYCRQILEQGASEVHLCGWRVCSSLDAGAFGAAKWFLPAVGSVFSGSHTPAGSTCERGEINYSADTRPPQPASIIQCEHSIVIHLRLISRIIGDLIHISQGDCISLFWLSNIYYTVGDVYLLICIADCVCEILGSIKHTKEWHEMTYKLVWLQMNNLCGELSCELNHWLDIIFLGFSEL